MSSEQQLSEHTGTTSVPVRRGRVDSVVLYEIKEDELNSLERGAPSSALLNLALFAWGSFFSFLATVLTVELKESVSATVFLFLTVLTPIAGLVLLVLWLVFRRDQARIIATIRSRLQDVESAAPRGRALPGPEPQRSGQIQPDDPNSSG